MRAGRVATCAGRWRTPCTGCGPIGSTCTSCIALTRRPRSRRPSPPSTTWSYFPLASGLLTGKYRRGEPAPAGTRLAAWNAGSVLTDPTFDVVEKLESFAAERSITLLDVAVGGLAAQPSVSSVIAGATSPEQVAANVKAGRWIPTADDLAEIDRITRPDGTP